MSLPRRIHLDTRRSGLWALVTAALLVALYGLLLYPRSEAEATAAEALVKRRIDRIERRTGIDQQATPSPASLQRDLGDLETRREALAARRAELELSFVPAHRGEAVQAQRLALADLAERAGLQILRQGTGTEHARAPDRVPSQPPLDARTARPYLEVEARGEYPSLRAFLFGLDALEFVSAPTALSISAAQPAGEVDHAAAAAPVLRVKLRLSL